MLKKYLYPTVSQINTIKFISEEYIGNQLPAANKIKNFINRTVADATSFFTCVG